MTVRPGKGGDGGWLKPSKDGKSEALDGEFTVSEGEFAKRKLWQLFTLRCLLPNPDQQTKERYATLAKSPWGHCVQFSKAHEESSQRTTAKLQKQRAISQAGATSTAYASWPKSAYVRRRVLIRRRTSSREVITPDLQLWKQPEQVPVAPPNGNGSGVAPVANATTTPTANAIAGGPVAGQSGPKWNGRQNTKTSGCSAQALRPSTKHAKSHSTQHWVVADYAGRTD